MNKETNQSAVFTPDNRVVLQSQPLSDPRRTCESPQPELIAGYGGASGRYMEVWALLFPGSSMN